MNKEEFLDFLDRHEKKMEECQRVEAAFMKKAPIVLFSYILNYYAECNDYKHELRKALQRDLRLCADELLESIGSAIYYMHEGKPYNEYLSPPKVTTVQESQKELQEFLEKVPQEDHEHLKEIHWDEYSYELRYQSFCKGLHDKAKELLVEFYELEILELNGDCLRLLEDHTYFSAVVPLIEKFYEEKYKICRQHSHQ